MIRLHQVRIAFGERILLDGADWHVREGAHVGLVGRNGAGKSTLLRAITGEVSLEAGRIEVRPNVRVGTLPQHAVAGSQRSVWEEASSRMERHQLLLARVTAAQAAVEAHEPGAVQRLADATEQFELAGGYRVDEKIGEVLHGLGFGPDTWHRPCATFSGGWQMRIALARLLLSEPDVALLDEPTNHLDLPTRGWLAGHLGRVPWTFVLVSHDRWLLDRAVGEIAEIRHRRLHTYAGNFSKFQVERALRDTQLQTAYERQQAEIERLERFVDRFKAKATKASQAQSRVKQLEKMERLDAPETDRTVRYRLPEAPPGDHEVLALQGATVAFGDRVVLDAVDFVLERGMRVALLGPNGCGKSTLLKALGGKVPLARGRRRIGQRTRLGIFDQDVTHQLAGAGTALDHLVAVAPLVPPERSRAVLGALGLTGDAALRPIEALSGGEKARVALAELSIRPHNALLLDEPTNHLDAETVDVLVDALSGFDGALVFVSHDRYVVERLATHVVHVRGGAIELRAGLTPEDFELEPLPRTGASAGTASAEDHAARKRRQRERERQQRRLAEVEQAVTDAERAVAALNDELYAVANDYEAARAVQQRLAETEARLEALLAEWEGLEAELADPSS